MSISPQDAATGRPLLGMMYGTLAYFCYSVQDTLVSMMARIYPPLLVTWIDCAVALALLLGAVMLRKGVRGLKIVFHTHQFKGHVTRGVFFGVGTAMIVTALPHMALPNMYVIVFLSPLLGASLSGVFLKEPVSPQKFAALLLGFGGVVVAMRPGPEGFNGYSLLVLGAALMFSANALLNRFLSQRDH
ncbi:MAG TPA: DMT family transporter, partial [Alphaproteobacteria bacterium]|nr:DMT family transporter [Alphaproteobacteria bacterium]